MNFDTIRGRTPASKYSFLSTLSGLRTGSIFTLAFLVCIGGYAIHETHAHAAGITGQTQKTTNAGCYCHCPSANSATTVSITTTATAFYTGQTYQFTATVSNSGEVDGGIDIATEFGSLGAITGQGLYLSNGELTHSAPKALTASWNFDWTAPAYETYDTIFATGNAVNGDGSNDGGNCTDKWNDAPKFIIHVQRKRIALGRSSIAFGQIRVGHRVADSLLVTSYGDAAITVTSSGMKSGAQFSSYPTSTNRTLNPGTTEMDSAIFAPSARGTFNDSLIFTTNSDTVPQQHIGVYVSGQGIQGIFSSTNGTSLSFGKVRAGRTMQQTFAFSNSGDDTLFLNAPSISGSGFSIVSGGASATLAPNQSGNVVVQFAPAAKQTYSGNLSFTAANGVSAPTVGLSGTGTLPHIQISSYQDLGSIRVGLTLQGSVVLQNIGTDTLHVSNAGLTQPSTRFTLGSFDQVVVPGASGTIHIAYLPDSEKTDSAVLHFTTDDPSDSAVSIVVTGSGLLPHMAVAENRDTVDLGQVKVNSSATQNIAVANDGATDLNLLSVTAGPSPFSLSQSPNVVTAETMADVTVDFAPTSTGTFAGMLVITGDDPANPSDTVYLKGTGINSALTINPASVNFGPVPVSTTAIDTVTLQNTGTASLQIEGYRLSSSFGVFGITDSSSHQVNAGGSALVVVRFHPDSAESYSGMITLTTDDASAPTRTINLSGRGVKGVLTVIPSNINFGSLSVGHDTAILVSLRNTGQASVTISKVTFTGPGVAAFSDGSFSTPAVIAAGDSMLLSLSFMPTIAQGYQGMAVLTLGDGTSVTIGLQGTGVSAAVAQDQIEPSEFSISLSPNPASNAFTVHATLQRAAETQLEIFDADGRRAVLMPLGLLTEGTHTIPVSTGALASGSYFIRISSGNGDRAEAKLLIDR